MSMRTGTVAVHDTSINVWEEDVKEKELMAEVYGPFIRFLRQRGYSIHRDPETKKRYRCISDRHHRGKKGDLEVLVQLSGRHIEIKFFQNLVTANRNGGQYDFDKYQKMPYLMKKRWLLEASAIIGHLLGHGYTLGKDLRGYSVQELVAYSRGIDRAKEPLRGFNDQWGADRFTRDETGWPVAKEYDYGSNRDREGVPLRNGMLRWYRDRKGCLKRGTIYTNMNCMWQLVYGPGRNDTTWVHCRELFTLQPTDPLRRSVSAYYREKALETQLAKALKEMRYERAAVLRDVLYGSREAALAKAAA